MARTIRDIPSARTPKEMHEYNRALDLHKLMLRYKEFRANKAITDAERADLLKDMTQQENNAKFHDTEAAYHLARVGRLETLSASRIRALQADYRANYKLGVAELGVRATELRTEASVLEAQRLLYAQQTSDLDELLRLGRLTGTAQTRQVAAERTAIGRRSNLFTQRQAGIAAGERTTTAMARRIATTRTRIGREGGVASAQLTRAGAMASNVQAQQSLTGGTLAAGRAQVAAGRAVLGAEASAQRLGARQRMEARTEQLGQEVASAEVSGAARGHTGSFQAVREAEAEQAFARDVARFELEDQVAELNLAQRDADLSAAAHEVERRHVAEVGRLDVSAKEAAVATQQAMAAQARVTEQTSGLGVETAQLGERRAASATERAQLSIDRALQTAAYRQLDAKQAQINQVQDQLRSRVETGKREVAVREAQRAGEVTALGDEQRGTGRWGVRSKQQAVVEAQRTRGREAVTQDETELEEAKARAGQDRSRSILQAQQQRRDKGRTSLEREKIRQEDLLQELAEGITRWQIQNLPKASDYKSTGRQSDLGLFLSGLASLVA